MRSKLIVTTAAAMMALFVLRPVAVQALVSALDRLSDHLDRLVRQSYRKHMEKRDIESNLAVAAS